MSCAPEYRSWPFRLPVWLLLLCQTGWINNVETDARSALGSVSGSLVVGASWTLQLGSFLYFQQASISNTRIRRGIRNRIPFLSRSDLSLFWCCLLWHTASIMRELDAVIQGLSGTVLASVVEARLPPIVMYMTNGHATGSSLSPCLDRPSLPGLPSACRGALQCS